MCCDRGRLHRRTSPGSPVVERLVAALTLSDGPFGACRGGLVVSVTHRELARQALVLGGLHTDLESSADDGV